MAEKRFDVVNTTNCLDRLVGIDRVVVRDNQTRNEGVGVGRDHKDAEEKAWQNLRDTQGPLPSELKKR